MARWGRKTPSGVQWPAEWGEEEGWPSVEGGGIELEREARFWASLVTSLHRSDIKASKLIGSLGGPSGHQECRTIKLCHEEISVEYRKTGRRPLHGLKRFQNWDRWLRKYHRSSVSRECDFLGIPAPLNLKRSIEQCRKDIQSYYKETGKPPSNKSSNEFNRWDQWLKRQGSSLSTEVLSLGLEPLKQLGRTIEQCHREIQSHFRRTGKRPAVTTSKEWMAWNNYLRYNHNSTLRQACDELGIPGGNNLTRTYSQLKKGVQSYYKENGKRPTERASKEWNGWSQWLRRQGSSLSKECDKLGLP